MIEKTIDEKDLYKYTGEIVEKTIKFGNKTLTAFSNVERDSSSIKVGSPILKTGITTRKYNKSIYINENQVTTYELNNFRASTDDSIDTEVYQAAKDFPFVSGFDFRSKKYLRLISTKKWIEVKIPNIPTYLLYNHWMHKSPQDTISLPEFNPTFSRTLMIDIDNNQKISPNKIKDQLLKDLGQYYYGEFKYSSGSSGIHLYFQFKTEVFQEARLFLEKYYLEKYKYKIECSLKMLRLPFSKAYYKNAKDGNGTLIESPAHLVEVFRNKDLFALDIPFFLKKVNKHGVSIQKTQDTYTDIGEASDNLISSYGNRIVPQLNLARKVLSQNGSFEDFYEACHIYTDGSSKDMNSSKKDKILKSLFDWAQSTYDSNIIPKAFLNKKPKKFLNQVEFEYNNEDFNVLSKILNFYSLSKKEKHNVFLLMEAVNSIFEYNKLNPKSYSEKEFKPFNDGVAISLDVIYLIGKNLKISNIRKIWKIAKSIFLKTITLENGYTYSYNNKRYSKHYTLLSLKEIFKLLLKKIKFYSKYIVSNISIYLWYNICLQQLYTNSLNKTVNLSNLQRAGP